MDRGKRVIEMTDAYHTPNYARTRIVFHRGEGVYIFDGDGKKYLDFLAGISVNVLGHSDPAVVSSVVEQATTLMHVSNLFYVPSQAAFLKEIASTYPWEGKSFLCNSGTEAVESAIKLARKYSKDAGKDEFRILSFRHSFHGRTFGALSATAQENYHKGFEPMLPGFVYLDGGDRESFDKALEEGICAVILEPIQGEGGVRPFDMGFLEFVHRRTKEKDVLLICDEIQCGIGRTGKFFAFEHYGIIPDLITIAKGVANGLPLGVMAARERVAEAFVPGTHGSTFGGNPVSCAAALEVVSRVRDPEFLSQVAEKGLYMREKLDSIAARFESVLEVRGMGLMQALVLEDKGAPVVDRCLDMGLIINCTEEKVLRFLPPLIVEPYQIDEAAKILENALG